MPAPMLVSSLPAMASAWSMSGREHAPAFEDLTRRLRATRKWNYLQREVDIRLSRP